MPTEKALANGAEDVIVVQTIDGELKSTPFHGQIGKVHAIFQSTTLEGKNVVITVNTLQAEAEMEISMSGQLMFLGDDKFHMNSSQLVQLNLNTGRNDAHYYVPDLDITVPFNIYLYHRDDKLVLTDIDKGHSLFKQIDNEPAVELFHEIRKREYQVVYLSTRPIEEDETTRSYLFESLQNLPTGFSLPMGPVFFSKEKPNLMRRVSISIASKTPDDVNLHKSSVINAIYDTFCPGPEKCPVNDIFVSGYANTEADIVSFRNCGFSDVNIWHVNQLTWDVKNMGTRVMTSYKEQATDEIDILYPHLEEKHPFVRKPSLRKASVIYNVAPMLDNGENPEEALLEEEEAGEVVDGEEYREEEAYDEPEAAWEEGEAEDDQDIACDNNEEDIENEVVEEEAEVEAAPVEVIAPQGGRGARGGRGRGFRGRGRGARGRGAGGDE